MNPLSEQATAAEEVGNLPVAFELWGKLVETDTDGIASLKYGALAIELERWDEAERALSQTLRLKPNFSMAMLFMGRLWTSRTDQDEAHSLQTAKHWYLKAVERKKDAIFLTLLGAACMRLDEISEAKAAFEEAIAIDPNYEEAMYNLAVLEEGKDRPKCVALLTRAIEIDPKYFLAHQALGRVLQKQGNLMQAEIHFRKSLEINPDDYFSTLYLANLLGVLRRNDEAEKTYRHAIALEPELEGGLRFFANFLQSIWKNSESAAVQSKAALLSGHD